ncbi:PRC and DUF2382 domain-containing protein [Corynebacterium frankenforstense]|uniref:PRC and DUF2382 domain-containing protein n=1 Tax=Corynebacterium TaxID=1716 RepID=UPI00254A90D0|nr:MULTISPECIES: PRC and DUF2382 domain-containing protein [Corynebacterium]MDK6259940.1 PRC and DUF2382 domain-containing protein [Corynebacterium frankenforstense]MDK8895365.1 PRC and DUF2382 domain-containing protein [Corynebacterium sp. MSK006]
MANERDLKELFEATAYDNTGDKLGDIKEIFVDDETGAPTFVEVGHGLFGMSSSLVPLRGANFEGDALNLAFSKDRVKDAPELDSDRNLTSEQQDELYRHYGVQDAPGITGVGSDRREAAAGEREVAGDKAGYAAAGAGAGAGVGAAADGKHHAEDDVDAERRAAADVDAQRQAAGNADEIIRSEERLNVGKERVASGEARLRKYVVEDTEQVEVPVTREEVRVERTPISEEDAKNFTGKIGEEEASVTLHEERVNVSKDTVPVEKIALNKEQVQDTETVSETVRKEQFDTEGVTDPKAGK